MEQVGVNGDNRQSFEQLEMIASVRSAHHMNWGNALVLLAGFVALDRISFFHPLLGLNITPWDPAPAIGLVFILRYGWQPVPLIALAIFLGDVLVRELAIAVSVVLAVTLAAGYAVIGELLRHRLGDGEIFSGRHGFFEWVWIVALGTFVNSLVFIGALLAFELVPAAEWSSALIRHWIGDVVGILVTMPVIWMLASEHGRAVLRALMTRGETLALLAASVLALWGVFRFGVQSEFKYFYVLFLPIVWAAARQGLAGAVLIATTVQLGIIFVVDRLGFSAVSVLEIQMLTVMLALLGFFVGVVIDEQRRISFELRQTLRLAAAGEMAGALAHELNQPLTALSAYAAACDRLFGQAAAQGQVREAIHKIAEESERAATVLARLRDFFRAGTTQLGKFSLSEMLDASVSSFAKRAQKGGIEIQVGPVTDCELLADRLQLEVVMRNLLSNACDAVSRQPPAARRIRVSAALEGGGRVCVAVEDSGPGLSAESVGHLFEPFQSTKSSGLGLGLAISRAIVDAHGGNLWAEVDDHGVFKLLLLTEGGMADDNP